MHDNIDDGPDPPRDWLVETFQVLGKATARARAVRAQAYCNCSWALVGIEADHLPVPAIRYTARGTIRIQWTVGTEQLTAEFIGRSTMTLVQTGTQGIDGPHIYHQSYTNALRGALCGLYPEIHQMTVDDWQQSNL